MTNPFAIDPNSIPNDGGGGSDASSWLSGLGDLFAGVGAGAGAIIASENTNQLHTIGTPGSGWVWDASRGVYVNPMTGQALTSTGTLPSAGLSSLGLGSNTTVLILLAIGAYLLFGRKHREA